MEPVEPTTAILLPSIKPPTTLEHLDPRSFTNEPRLSKASEFFLRPIFDGNGSMYAVSMDFFWIQSQNYLDVPPKPHDISLVIEDILRMNSNPKIKDLVKTMRVTRNKLYHPNHPTESSVFIKTAVRLRSLVEQVMIPMEGLMNSFGINIINRINLAISQTETGYVLDKCPECHQKFPVFENFTAPEISFEGIMTFGEFKAKYGMDPLKGRKIRYRYRGKDSLAIFRSWAGKQVYIDDQQLGRRHVLIESMFALSD